MNVAIGLLGDTRLGHPPQASKGALRLRLYIGLVLTDLIAIALSITLAGWWRLGTPLSAQAGNMMLVTFPLFLLSAFNSRAYSVEVLVEARRSVQRAVSSATLTTMTVIGIAFCLKASEEMSRLLMALAFFGSIVLLTLGRCIMVKLSSRLLKGRPTGEIMICDGGLPPGVGPTLPVIHASSAGLLPGITDPVMLDRIGRAIYGYDRVIVACPLERRRAWALALKGSGINVEIMAPELDEIGMVATGRYDGSATAVVALDALGLRDRILKRALDLAVVLPLLLLLPLLAVVVIAIKLESPGPVLFVQRRVGQGNRLFSMYKFRSMRVDTLDHGGARSASRDDDRITRVGALLRRTSIDEVPQLFNVLKGNMSVAGPRPHAVASTAENKLFWEVDERYFDRHAVKPGLTGLAQIRGFRGATLTRSDLSNRVQADLEYLAGWSIWRDVAIILRTFKVMIHRNAF